MPDWLAPPQVLLFAAPTAMILAAYALAAGERRAGARRRREELGAAQGRVEAGRAGERVVLEGRLDVIESACARFEDGREAAVATVESTGIRAVPGGTRIDLPSSGMPGVSHSVRGGVLVLTVGPEHVIVNGPASVIVGSDETDPGAPFAALAASVRERIAGVAGAASLPDAEPASLPEGAAFDPEALKGRPVHAAPLFRSVRSGARVWAAGVLSRQSDGERAGYRERARWALTGTAADPVQIAFDGAPRHRGGLSSALRGVRQVAWTRAAAVAVAIVAALGALAFAANRHGQRPPHARQAAPAQAQTSILDHENRCDGYRRQYQAAAAALAKCSADADCTAEVRAGAYYNMEGCYRYRNTHASTAQVEAIEKAWVEEACALSYEMCPARPLVMCREGQCVERPPAPVPETWHREEVPGGFYLYVPAETKSVPGAEGAVARYRGAGMDIRADVGEHDLRLGDEEAAGQRAKIAGRAARVWRSPRQIRLLFEESSGCGPPRCPYFAEGEKLLLQASCDSEEACGDAWTALQSVHLW
jgi:hypothetical protein